MSKDNRKFNLKFSRGFKNPRGAKTPHLKFFHGQFTTFSPFFSAQDSFEMKIKIFLKPSGSKETKNLF
jgi:hypothetical protein